LNNFFDDGFVIKQLFHPDEYKGVIESINGLVDIVADGLYKGGKIKDLAKNAGFYERLAIIEKQYPGSSVLLHKQGILPPAISDLCTEKRLLDIADQLLGGELAGHPVWNLRTKTPHNEQATVPWHQDTAYLAPEAWKVLQVTAWIPLIDANLVNGCMQVLRGGHKTGITAKHNCCAGGTWYIELSEEEMTKTLGCDMKKDLVTCEVPLGSVLFLNNIIPHRSLENNSDKIRWSLDLRWQNPKLANGFYGLKDNILMRTASDPHYVPDWERWNKKNRSVLQEEATNQETKKTISEIKKKEGRKESDPFDTTISGPWMHQWPIIHHNKHTKTLDPTGGSSSWHKS